MKAYRVKFWGWGAVLWFSSLLCLVCTDQVVASAPDWVCKVVSLQGDVRVHRNGLAEWEPLRLNDTLNAGDRVRVMANSRAGLVLRNDAVLRLDQHTNLVFSEIESESTFIFRLLKGAANFFSRRPRSLKIFTPFVNGVVEGTEFYVQVNADHARIELYEGRIAAENNYGTLQMESGQGAVASAELAPKPHLLVQPRDSVAWAIYYPPILSMQDGVIPEALAPAITKFQEGRPDEAIADAQLLVEEGAGTRTMVYQAGMLLNVGRVTEAQRVIREVLSQNPGSSGALALRTIIAVVQNRKAQALEIGASAVKRDPQSTAAQIALSYARQALFDLSGALVAARAAVDLTPENPIAWSRLAELHLATGDLARGEEAAIQAASFDPRSAHASSLLGFAYLTQIKIKQAKAVFEQSILLDSTAPLPRLGLGLAMIRNGDLSEGRAQIEIAASLDPLNALIRSYLGKAYFDEKRGPLDQRQFGISKMLDPNDPTPWLYDAIAKQSLNRPVEALQDLQHSISLNDNRAVYRSRLMLDKDRSARGVSLARIYDDLRFKQRAQVESAKSLSMDPTNYSAHRFLSDTYVQLPQRQIAQVSERLQAQLFQPVNVNPIQPQLSIKGLNLVPGMGLGQAAFNEYTPLFERNRPQFTVSGVGGNNETFGDEMVLSGLEDNFSYSFGQFHYESDGFREMADIEHDIYNGFMQAAITNKANIQFEFRHRNTQQGDLRLSLDPGFIPTERRTLRQNIFRTGLHLSPSPRSDVIASVIYSDRREYLLDDTPDVLQDYTFDDRDGYNAETQYLFRETHYNFLIGGGIYRTDQEAETVRITAPIVLPPPFPPIPGTTTTNQEFADIDGENLYVYSNINFPDRIVWTVGLSYQTFEISQSMIDIERIYPKIGLQWDLTDAIRLRGAFVKNIKRLLAVEQTIEPTQVAGFNQFFDDANGTRTEMFGLALDARPTEAFYAGAEFVRRDLAEVFVKKREEQYRGYLYWMPHARWALNVEYQFVKDERAFELTTHSVPASIRYFDPNGFFGQVGVTPVWQDETSPVDAFSDHFVVVDAALGFRLPKRLGAISIECGNLFDKAFRYRDSGFKTFDQFNVIQPFVPTRTILVRAVLNF